MRAGGKGEFRGRTGEDGESKGEGAKGTVRIKECGKGKSEGEIEVPENETGKGDEQQRRRRPGKETGRGPRLKSRPSPLLLSFLPVEQPELRVDVFVRLVLRLEERPEHVQPIH